MQNKENAAPVAQTTCGHIELRDWFAGQALAGFMANTKRPTTIHEDDATWCYEIADAMLAERGKSDV